MCTGNPVGPNCRVASTGQPAEATRQFDDVSPKHRDFPAGRSAYTRIAVARPTPFAQEQIGASRLWGAGPLAKNGNDVKPWFSFGVPPCCSSSAQAEAVIGLQVIL